MSKRGIDFARNWVFENINAGPYNPGDTIIDNAVKQLSKEAAHAGIPLKEIEEDTGSLVDFVAQAFDEATDNEVQRLSSKDD